MNWFWSTPCRTTCWMGHCGVTSVQRRRVSPSGSEMALARPKSTLRMPFSTNTRLHTNSPGLQTPFSVPPPDVYKRQANPNAVVVGTVTLIYDHHASGITEKLTEVQHAQHKLVVSTSHAHLDHESCLEVLIVHGKSVHVEQFAGRLISLKGVQHGRLVMTVPAHSLDHHVKNGHPQNHKH